MAEILSVDESVEVFEMGDTACDGCDGCDGQWGLVIDM